MKNDNQLPVVCTLTPETMATRKANLLSSLARQAAAREDVGESIRLRFSADALQRISSTIEAERRCCRFLQFDVTVEPDAGSIWLTLSGPPGTREFLTALIDS